MQVGSPRPASNREYLLPDAFFQELSGISGVKGSTRYIHNELARAGSGMPNSRAVPPQVATFQQYSLQKTAHMVVSQHRKMEQDGTEAVAMQGLPQPNDKAQRKYKHEGDDDDAGFTRSISLYWHWVRCQRAAARLGKVSSQIPAWFLVPRNMHCSPALASCLPCS